MKKLTMFIFLTGLILGFIITGSLGPAAAAEKDKYGGVMRMAINKGPAVFGYPLRVRGIDNFVSHSALENLILAYRGKSTIDPNLATDWDVAPDRMSVTFKLRKGVKFHDGTDWNAQAAKFNLDPFAKSKNLMTWLKSVDIIDDHAIRLNMKTPYNLSVMTQLSRGGLNISPTAFEKNGEKWCETHPVGTGPFKFEKYSRDEVVRYNRFDGYWKKGRPYFDGLDFMVIKNVMTQIAAIKTDKIDGLYNIPNDPAKLLRDEGYVLHSHRGPVVTIAGDTINPASVWSNRKVREAIEYAIDKETLTKKLGYGFQEPAYQIINQGNTLGCQDCPPRKYDPAKAKKLLAEAGYPNGVKVTFQHYNKSWPESWVAIQADLRKVGIDMEVIPIDRGKWAKMMQAGGTYVGATHIQFGSTEFGLMAYMSGVRSTSEGGNRAPVTLRPPGVDDNIAKALQTPDPAIVENLLRKVNKLVYDDITFIPVYVQVRISVTKKNVHDFKYGIFAPDGMEVFTNAWMSKN
jgi:peptide/nickel transport system substrate-binding protein